MSFLLLDGSLHGAAAGDALTISGAEGRHGAAVVRLKPNEHVFITDQHRHQVLAEVTAAAKQEFTVRLLERPRTAEQRTPQLVLVQALAKGGRDENAVQTCTELGADAIIPWQADRSIVKWSGGKEAKGQAKWLATVHAAVKQSRRPTIPNVEPVVRTTALVQRVKDWAASGSVVLVLHEAEQKSLMQLAPSLAAAEQIVLIVGPEGGISDEEITRLRQAGARTALLGPEVVRASTAGPAAIAVLSALTGRWGTCSADDAAPSADAVEPRP